MHRPVPAERNVTDANRDLSIVIMVVLVVAIIFDAIRRGERER